MFKLMAGNVMRQLYSNSMYGEVKAAKLYMQLLGVLRNNGKVENNFLTGQQDQLMLREIPLTEELLDNLTPQQRDKIEEVLKEAGANPSSSSENRLSA